MPKIVTKPRWTPPEPSDPIGTLLPGSSLTSKLEEQVRERLTAAGVGLCEKRLGIQCGFDEARNRYPVLTPDFLIRGAKVCVEIDPANVHEDRIDQDQVRNELLEAAGWRVVRLRLGGLKAIGDWDVVSDTSGATVAAVASLVEAIGDAVAGRPGRLRTVKGKPAAPRKKSRLGAIREDEYKFGVHNVRWSLDGGEVLDLAVVGNGRYLGRVMKSEFPRYVRPLDLVDVPKDGWRKALEPLPEGMDASEFEPVSTFPWGDSLFIGPQAGTIYMKDKFSPFGPGEVLTTNLECVHEYNEAAIQGEDHTVLVELHAEAIALGWKIESVRLESGRHGDYQRIVLTPEGFKI
ncbi:uncharacterized protein DUF559 [Arthrobacter sp. SLBN-100]|uniref:DUF559 domain-containing protein n=1 Tax=Arthrobacter sp. SLBN-100 TaxID=2768450 RepID=UPI001150B475|nr:DUF559 domain-containing protein [Arthrobacter sp. SLBN-100]TQJ66566.1 uncharacterized protein DUF559 [Arthrobacter sp. SLBN-100]